MLKIKLQKTIKLLCVQKQQKKSSKESMPAVSTPQLPISSKPTAE